ncbi:ATP-dependent DNA helicase RecG [Anaplasma platys]|uniref:ATP-dependent DNA helicase RecG n=1 Tax=Anaplasma platys TaxID=949 RepID=A0A858PZC1_9RICK|nr:ATP-dependent DNA helicase RecG [Anaplasma platys]QJC27929.1 ATP-dependent DNA helicase RecG [Anaplasma platys]
MIKTVEPHAVVNDIPKRSAKNTKVLGIFSSIYEMNGVDNEKGALLEKLCGGPRLIDLILFAPSSYLDRRNTQLTRESACGSTVTFVALVKKHIPPPIHKRRGKSVPYKVLLGTEIGDIWLIFFNYSRPYLENVLLLGNKCVVSGKLDVRGGVMQITHPDYFTNNVNKLPEICTLEPVYSVTRGINSRYVQKLIRTALKFIKPQPEWLPSDLVSKNSWMSWQESVARIHKPQGWEDVRRCRERLSHDELLGYNAAVAFVRQYGRGKGISVKAQGVYHAHVLRRLGFELTAGQQAAIDSITYDQASEYQMTKLLQGDVGCGKTVVALFAMLNAIEVGGQIAFMVPTEILAEQHCSWISNVLEGLDICVELLTGRTKSRAAVNEKLAAGEIQIVVGTHALFQESVKFSNLRLVVIDEQQRFGVLQRMKLIGKGECADILFMTATPIPRTLEQIVYGNMDRITLPDKPKCRLPVITSMVKVDRIDEVCLRMQSMLAGGHKAYWICPYIEEGEQDNNIASAEKRYKFLQESFGDMIGIVHGALPQATNDDTIRAFHSGKIKLLVATSIIEVGINVPDATIMVIENPERFGLSQLHQIRGRVGRGDKQSFCILLHGSVGNLAYRKLCVLQRSQDGFYIAEQDLLLRGGGDMLGCRQSGVVAFRFADPSNVGAILRAHDEATSMMSTEKGRKLAYRITRLFGHTLPKINY